MNTSVAITRKPPNDAIETILALAVLAVNVPVRHSDFRGRTQGGTTQNSGMSERFYRSEGALLLRCGPTAY